MRYSIEIDTKAVREIRALPRRDQALVVAKIESLALNPRPAGCTKLAGGAGLWRVRSGDFRVIYLIQDSRLIITVVKVGNRRDVYRGI